MLALARHGLVAGHDMAVTGFDDTAEAAQLSPALTTVAVDAARLGAEAAAMLLRRIDAQSLPEPELDPTQTFLGDTQLIIRQSSGAPLLHRTSA
jgi:LacI family transcriptional regulator